VLQFESHNIELADGTQTLPGQPLIRDTGLAKASLRAAQLFAPVTPDYRPRVIDLGCREGGFAVEFARAGYEVLGLEARQSNVDRCHIVEDSLQIPHLTFVRDDARNIRHYGEFDICFNSGLLYHLDEPVRHLADCSAITKRLLILNTHYSTDAPTPAFDLSEQTEHEGVRGRWYRDLDPSTTLAAMEENRGASWGNANSFWVEKHHLMAVIRAVGFDLVLEQFDFLDDIVEESRVWIGQQTRSQFLGVKL
jgi:SAM-dependent methyltransferase